MVRHLALLIIYTVASLPDVLLEVLDGVALL